VTPRADAIASSEQLDRRVTIPGAQHYHANYLGSDAVRLYSYRTQISYVLRSRARSVLIVGKGDGLVGRLLTEYGMKVTTLDVTGDLQPDLIGSVISIPTANRSFEAALCCQVLEHLPFSQFRTALREIRRVTRGTLILSLPDIRRFFSIRLAAARFSVDWQVSIPRFPSPTVPEERTSVHGHFWEIGFRGTPFGVVREDLVRSGWRVHEVRRVSDLPWHTFFYCEVEAQDAP
jgi:hypothetical protein